MIVYGKEEMFQRCEELGEETVRAQLQGGSLPVTERPLMQEWLNLRDAAKRAQQAKEQQERADLTLAIAERSTAASERSAAASERSSRIALYAVIIAVASIGVNVVKSCAG